MFEYLCAYCATFTKNEFLFVAGHQGRARPPGQERRRRRGSPELRFLRQEEGDEGALVSGQRRGREGRRGRRGEQQLRPAQHLHQQEPGKEDWAYVQCWIGLAFSLLSLKETHGLSSSATGGGGTTCTGLASRSSRYRIHQKKHYSFHNCFPP